VNWRKIGAVCWSTAEYIAALAVLLFFVALLWGSCGCARTLEYCEDGCAGAAGAAAEGSAGAGGAGE
jgi:hypothetical protein